MQVKNKPVLNRKMKQSDWMANILPVLKAQANDSISIIFDSPLKFSKQNK